MADRLEHATLEDFPLRWRFAEDASKWTVLPEADLQRFRPLSAACSREQWQRFVTASADHLMAAGEAGPLSAARLAEFREGDDWTSPEETERVGEFLRRHVPLRDDDLLLFFWGASCAVETTWDVLLRYWSDFCYPSDDSNVAIPFEGDRLIVYVEGLTWVSRRDLPGPAMV